VVSVLLPFLNAAPWLEECLSSIQAQTLTDWECILVDDGSSDGSLEIAMCFVTADARFRLIDYPGGPPDLIAAQRRALHFARGEYVTRMDADDRMHPLKLEALLTGQSEGRGLSAGQVEFFGNSIGPGTLNYQNWLNERIEKGDFLEHLYKECPVANPCWMLDKATALDAFENLQYPEDYHFIFKLVEMGIPIVPCPEAKHYWREHSERLSKTDLYSTERFTQLKWKMFQRLENPQRLWLLGHGKKAKFLRSLMHGNSLCAWLTERPSAHGNRIGNDTLLHVEQADIQKGDRLINTLSSLEDWSCLEQALEQKGARIYRWA
jgi:glycosyltransferase involved in cell wall biosynthesis